MSDDDDICGAECGDGTPCQHPADDCPVSSHSDPEAENSQGRPSKFNERRKELVLTAVRAGLKFADQASHAQVHPDTLRRRLCCINTPRKAVLTDDDPCDFCEDYVRAHSEGALSVLEECRPEFRASASFGYTEKTEVDASHEHTGEGGGPIMVIESDDGDGE